MKVFNFSFADSAAAAYTLCHALNKKIEGMEAVNMRANDNYLNYPTISHMRNYDRETVKRMILRCDVLVFHTAMQAFMAALGLSKEDLKDKKKLLYFHGSDCRVYGDTLLEQADEAWEDYQILVSTPDLLKLVPKGAEWLPVCRSFTDIKRLHSPSVKDRSALESYGEPHVKTMLGHAPTNPEMKGTNVFMRVITRVIEDIPTAHYRPMQNIPWDSCLKTMGTLDVFYDQCVLGAYGTAAVEASIFELPTICLLKQDVVEHMAALSGKRQPFIQFKNEDDLYEISMRLCMDAELRHDFGRMAYIYSKAIHDEKPVAERFMKIVSDMP